MTAALFIALLQAAEPVRVNQAAPALTGADWINASGLPKGKVMIVHFWTYGCYNCRNNLPAYERWQERFTGRPVAMVGVHTPEFPNEANPANVREQVKRLNITWPVLLDPKMENWRRWRQQFWPCVYLVDARGRVRYRWDGELNWRGQRGDEMMAAKVEELLKESE
jgi:thiol-disulfide isomerase/thioredoxin